MQGIPAVFAQKNKISLKTLAYGFSPHPCLADVAVQCPSHLWQHFFKLVAIVGVVLEKFIIFAG